MRLTLKLDLQVDPNGILAVSGIIELWEGQNWNMEGSDAIDPTHIQRGETQLVYSSRVDDDEVDWATVKLEVENADG